MNDQEKKVMDLLIEAHNQYVQLATQHGDDIKEWVFHLHAMQRIVATREAVRNLKNEFSNCA